MIDYFLMYSFNIIIVVMIYHTYQAAHIAEEFAPNEEDKQLEKVIGKIFPVFQSCLSET